MAGMDRSKRRSSGRSSWIRWTRPGRLFEEVEKGHWEEPDWHQHFPEGQPWDFWKNWLSSASEAMSGRICLNPSLPVATEQCTSRQGISCRPVPFKLPCLSPFEQITCRRGLEHIHGSIYDRENGHRGLFLVSDLRQAASKRIRKDCSSLSVFMLAFPAYAVRRRGAMDSVIWDMVLDMVLWLCTRRRWL